MLEQISELVKQFGQDAVVDNPDVPNEENNAVLAEAANTITGGMQNMLAGGGLQDIISMFAGDRGDSQSGSQGGIVGLLKNPMVAMMIGHLISKLVSKFKMSPSQASNISNNLIPNVLNGLIARTKSNNPADDSYDFNDLIGSLTGGNTATAESGGGFNFQQLLEQLTRGGANGGGDFDLQDIVNQVARGAQQNQEEQARGRGGFADLIKGFFS